MKQIFCKITDPEKLELAYLIEKGGGDYRQLEIFVNSFKFIL